MKCELDTNVDVDEEDEDVDPQPEVVEWSLCTADEAG